MHYQFTHSVRDNGRAPTKTLASMCGARFEKGTDMFQTENKDGLARLARLELDRLHPASREEAFKILTGRMGAYSGSQEAIASGINAYFAEAVSG